MVALFAICLAGVITSHAVAPASAAAVVSLVSTTVGFLFAAVKKSDDDKPDTEPPKPAAQPPTPTQGTQESK